MSNRPSPVEEQINWLYSTQMFGIKLGLENITKLLRESESFPPSRTKVIQVVGTNGKGSTCAFIESIAKAHGMRVGLFTSPHLISFNERMRINGIDIPDEELVEHLAYFRELVADWDPHPSFFELSLALAMRYFLAHRCELIILEAGMGGRLDATSAVPKDLAVITPIGLDHQQYLGDTLNDIAGEKGAVMRPSVPCVSAPQEKEARLTLKQIASETRCPLTFIEKPFSGMTLGLSGEHQAWNAALALEAMDTLLGTLRFESVKSGLEFVQWRGRFQTLESNGRTTILDCCHNVPAAQALVAQWQSHYGEAKAHLIFGAAKDKNISGVLEILLPICSSIEVYTLNNPRAEDASELAKLVNTLDRSIACAPIATLQEASEHPLTLVTGSLFLVGEWLEFME